MPDKAGSKSRSRSTVGGEVYSVSVAVGGEQQQASSGNCGYRVKNKKYSAVPSAVGRLLVKINMHARASAGAYCRAVV